MINSSIIFIGLDTHKEFVEVAYVEDDRNARYININLNTPKLRFILFMTQVLAVTGSIDYSRISATLVM